MGKKINLQKMLKEIKEDESMETRKEKKWASQEDIRRIIKDRKGVNKKAE